jgi:hypothetical protein
MMRPFALEITARDFAFAAGHRLTAISLLAGTLNSRGLLHHSGLVKGLYRAKSDGFVGAADGQL